MVGCCDHGNELPGSIKCREFVEYLRNRPFMKKSYTCGGM